MIIEGNVDFKNNVDQMLAMMKDTTIGHSNKLRYASGKMYDCPESNVTRYSHYCPVSKVLEVYCKTNFLNILNLSCDLAYPNNPVYGNNRLVLHFF